MLITIRCCSQSSSIDPTLTLNVRNNSVNTSSIYVSTCQRWNGQSIQSQRRGFHHSRVCDLVGSSAVLRAPALSSLCRSQSSILLQRNSWTWRSCGGILHVSPLQPAICYLPVKKSSDWAASQQSNEPSPTSLPCAITYLIKSVVVSSLVIVMNMQGVNFFVSHSLGWRRLWGLTKRASWLDPSLLHGRLVEVNALQTRTKCCEWDVPLQQRNWHTLCHKEMTHMMHLVIIWQWCRKSLSLRDSRDTTLSG